MSSRLFRYLKNGFILENVQQIRKAHRIRGKPPTIARSLQQRLDEINYKDPAIYFRNNIGYHVDNKKRPEAEKSFTEAVKKMRTIEMEKKSRKLELLVDLDLMKKEWSTSIGPFQIKTIADHYGIFNDLYGDAYFYPVLPLDIKYNLENSDIMAPVYRGNLLKPTETKLAPTIHYESKPDSLWTLLLTTPDGNFTSREMEYCHWFIGNIPGNNLEKGDVIMDYMMPIPVHGIGYCRYVFVLYKQEKKIDFSEYKQQQPCVDLKKRNWKTYDFYKKYEDIITPAGLGFFQADWDDSVQDYFHKTLNIKAPMYEYDFPAPYLRPQEWFPKKRPFNLYLDKYRDPKEINEGYLVKKLKKCHPFKEPPAPLKYPSAQYLERNLPSWLVHEIRKERRGEGRMNDIE